MSTIEAVLWDVDGTLILSEPLHFRALQHAGRRFGLEPTEELHRLVVGRSAEDVYAYCRERLGLRASLGEWLTVKYEHYLARVHELRPRPGALEAWRRFADAGLRQAVVSNSDRIVVGANVRQLDLEAPRLVSVTRNDVVNGKPDPEPYLRAAQLLGAAPTACVAIEDSPTGARSALNAGMRVYGWPEDPGFVFDDGVEVIDDIAAVTLP